nr:MAG: putative nucleoprotein [Chuviridae sp.]WAS28175.1 MAG: putative nucleoprotein [Chuviridae sp.]
MAAPARYTRNPHDNKRALEAYFQTTTLLDNIFTNTTILEDAQDKMAAIWILARGDAYKRKAVNLHEMTVALAIANGIAPSMATKGVAAADLYAAQCVGEFFRRELRRRDLVVIDEATYAEWIAAPQEGVRPAGPLRALELPADWTAVSAQEFRFSTQEAKAVLNCLIQHPSTTLQQAGMYLYSMAFVSFAKRGEITARKLSSITTQLQENFGLRAELEGPVLRYIYENVGKHIPEGHVGPMFRAWAEDVKDLSMRLRVTLEQAADTGLTQYNTIKRAMLDFPTFPWDKVAALLPLEMENFNTALQAVGNDAYYGFRLDIGPAAASKFQSLAWLCKELYIKRGGTEADALTHFRGWIGTPLQRKALTHLMDNYQEVEEGAPIPTNAVLSARVLESLRATLPPPVPAHGPPAVAPPPPPAGEE